MVQAQSGLEFAVVVLDPQTDLSQADQSSLDPHIVAHALLDLYLGTLYRWSRESHSDATMHDGVTAAVEPYLSGMRAVGDRSSSATGHQRTTEGLRP
jgi:hypothetical protein